MLKTTIPTLEIKTTGIDLSTVQTITITIKQKGGYTVEKGNDDIEVDNDIMSISLSQTQYTKLKEGDISVSISATRYDGVTQKVKLTWVKFGSRTGYDGGSGGGGEYDILPTVEAVEANTEAGKLVDALAVKEVFQSVSDGKEKIASAITDKGVETDATATFDVMAENIASIQSGGGTSRNILYNFIYSFNSVVSGNGVLEVQKVFLPKGIKRIFIKNFAMYATNKSGLTTYVYFGIYGQKNGENAFVKRYSISTQTTEREELDSNKEINVDGFESIDYISISFSRLYNTSQVALKIDADIEFEIVS